MIDVVSNHLKTYPFAQIYILNEIYSLENKKEKIVFQKKNSQKLKSFLAEIDTEIEAGKVNAKTSREFIINLLSLISYPLIMKSFFEDIYEFNKDDWNSFIQNRKENILNLLLKSPKE